MAARARLLLALLCACACAAAVGSANAAAGRKMVGVYELKAGDFSVSVTNWGATITSVILPDSKGNLADVVLGYDTIGGYVSGKGYFGALVGRVANRIANARFVLDGKAYHLFKNDGNSTLHGSASLMSSLREIPALKGDNYNEWKRKIDFAFTIAEVDWVLTEPCPTMPVEPVRETGESDVAWDKRKKDFGPIRMAYDIKHARWVSDNKKCCAVIENTIEPAIAGSIEKCETATGYFERIKNQFTGSSKVYATHLFKQLTNEKYKGGGIRDHILKMSHLANKLKAMDLEIQPQLLIHFVFASLPKDFDNFVINYNMQPEKWDLDKLIAQCVDEELRINGQ